MSVTDGQKASAANLNAAFVSKTVDSEVGAIVGLNDPIDPNSGDPIVNTQRAINETFDAVGMTGEGDTTRKQYASMEIVANGDSHKVAIGKLDAQVKQNTDDIALAVLGPGTVTDRAIPVFDGTSGTQIAATGATIDGSGNTDLPGNLTVNGDLDATGAGNIGGALDVGGAATVDSLAVTNDATVGGDMVVTGNLTVNGTTTSINTADLDVEDKNIKVNLGGNDVSSEGAGLTVDRTGTKGSFIYADASATKFKVGAQGSEDDVVGRTATQTLTNKTLTAPVISTISNTGTLTLPTSTDTLVGRATTDTLTNKTLTTPVVDVLHTTEQGSTPATPSAGTTKVYSKSDGKLYKLSSDGLETEIGSGATGSGTGAVEYCTNPGAETNTTGWATYADAAAATPADGTGGSPNVTLARTTTASEIIRGTASFKFSKDAANRQGQGFSYDFSADPQDYKTGAPILISFEYKNSSAYASDDIQLFVYDRDGATMLTVFTGASDETGKIKSSTAGTRFTGYFYPTNSTSNDYRLIGHIATTNASAYDLFFDTVHIGGNNIIPGAIVSEWQSFTPTGSWSTNTTYTGKWRRVGDIMECLINISLAGAPTSANLTVNIPSGYTIDTAKLINSGGSVQLIGGGHATDSGTAQYRVDVRYSTTTAVEVIALGASGTYVNQPSFVTQAVPFTFGASDSLTLFFEMPISGWAATAALSTTEALFSTVRARYTRTTAQTVANNTATIVNFATQETNGDPFSAVTTGASWKFTSPKNAWYRVSGKVVMNATATGASGFDTDENIDFGLFKNGTLYANLDEIRTYSGQDYPAVRGATTVYVPRGEYIDLRITHQAGGSIDILGAGTENFVDIVEIPDFSAFGVYSQFEFLSSNSSEHTPTGTDRFHAMTGNSLTLTPGTWRLFGSVSFGAAASTGYLAIGHIWGAANGANTNTQPNLISTASGVTVLGGRQDNFVDQAGADNRLIPVREIVIRTTAASTTVYLVPYSNETTPSNGRINVTISAQRLQ